jgi:phospholipid/cholesterol/gamma-HCH transport system ATP-binding protein
MEIGDNILFLKNGKKAWQGRKFFRTDNRAVVDLYTPLTYLERK